MRKPRSKFVVTLAHEHNLCAAASVNLDNKPVVDLHSLGWSRTSVEVTLRPVEAENLARALEDGLMPLPDYNDIHLIASMVVLLEGPVTYDPYLKEKRDSPVYRYTCKHHDKATGNCGIYERRPALCRAYPNGAQCRYPGCSAV